MIQKKICMLGAFAVGKTSLVLRFVRSIFSEKYHITVGVKIDKKMVEYGGQQINLVLWDLAGEDAYQSLQLSYLRGSSGYLFVVDGTRQATLDKAMELQQRATQEYGSVPFVLVLNKADLAASWELDEAAIDELKQKGWDLVQASAKSGAGVEEAFLILAGKMIRGSVWRADKAVANDGNRP